MRIRAWVAAAVGTAGLAAQAAGQPANPAPTDFLLPPVASAPVPLKPKGSARPVDYTPIRQAVAEEYPDDRPPPRSSGASDTLRPIPPSSRSGSRSTYPDDELPPPRKPAPRYDDEYAPAPAPKKPAPRYAQYDDDVPPPTTRKPAKPRYADESDPPPPPTRYTAPIRNDGYDEAPPPPKKKPAPRYDDPIDDAPPAPPKKKSAPRYDDEYDAPPPPRRGTQPPLADDELPPPRAATMSRPQDVRPVSAEEIDRSRTAAEDRREDPNDLIGYLTGEGRGYNPDGLYKSTGMFGDKMTDVLGSGSNPDRKPLQSDHCFDTFVSPVTNPFLFEDPRSLTEVRPMYIYQKVPGSQPLFQGGNIQYLGVQGRVAFTDRLSLVFHKLGGIGINPTTTVAIPDHTGFAEFWLGPKYTFLRNTETGAVAAGGIQFQVPTGPYSVFQDTGSLSVTPYLSYAQNFLRSRSGSFNGILNTGYAFSTNDERSDYYYLSAHLDYDVGGKHRFYPLMELNWFYYTTNGSSQPFRFEGRDLINFGAQAKGSNLLTGALGGRVKVFKSSEIGAAFEIPLSGNRELFDYRWTLDFIWRY